MVVGCAVAAGAAADPAALMFTLRSPLVPTDPDLVEQVRQYAEPTFTPRRPLGTALVTMQLHPHPSGTRVVMTEDAFAYVTGPESVEDFTGVRVSRAELGRLVKEMEAAKAIVSFAAPTE